MGCFVFLAAFVSARFALFLTWLLTTRMGVAFTSGWIGLLGFFILPWTTLAWTWMYQPAKNGVDGFGVIVVVFAFIVDVASYGSGDRERRQRSRR